MYFSAYDERSLALVSLQTGTFTEAGFARALAAIEGLAADAAFRGAPATWVSVVGPSAEPPNASMRKRLADANRNFGALRMALVTTSVAHRSVLTAIHWLNPPRPDQLYATFASFEEARGWVEAQAGAAMPVLGELLERVRREADRDSVSRRPAQTK
ncbi:MAG TPA: hypothetical protein VFS43_03525 [Polyangiaceae bacterium]|nr:hypothetical protein [Polyangiaceae bacterium]